MKLRRGAALKQHLGSLNPRKRGKREDPTNDHPTPSCAVSD